MPTTVFSMQITRVNDDYQVTTITSPSGNPVGNFKPIYILPYQKEAMSLALEAPAYYSAQWHGEGADEFFQALKDLHLATENGFNPDLCEQVGKDLYKALFGDNHKLEQALAMTLAACSAAEPARIELRFSDEAVELATYPWELMFGQERNFLFSTPIAGLVRYIACNLPFAALPQSDRLRLLLVSSRPVDDLLVKLPGDEKAAITSALSDSLRDESIRIDVLPKADRLKSTWEQLNEYLIKHKGDNAPHIFHFDGHGGFGRLCPACKVLNRAAEPKCRKCGASLQGTAQGYLAFEDRSGCAEWINAQQLAVRLTGGGVRLACLSACKSAVMGGNSVFTGMAPALIQAGIPAVVAMQFSISVNASEKFIGTFYQCLSNGDTLVSAVSQARANMFIDPNAWYRPVLYLRTDDKNPDGSLISPLGLIGSPGSYLRVTKKHGIDQRKAVTTFAGMIMPEYQAKNQSMLLIEADPKAGKSTAMEKFATICDLHSSKRQLLFVRFAPWNEFAPVTLVNTIMYRLGVNAESNPRFNQLAGFLKAKEFSSGSSSSGLPVGQQADQEVEWRKLAKDFCGQLRDICKETMVILLIDDFQIIADKDSGKWLKEYFLPEARNINQVAKQNFIIVIAGEKGLREVSGRGWPEVAFLDVINDIDIDDVQELAMREEYGIRLSREQAEFYKNKANGNMEKLKDLLDGAVGMVKFKVPPS